MNYVSKKMADGRVFVDDFSDLGVFQPAEEPCAKAAQGPKAVAVESPEEKATMLLSQARRRTKEYGLPACELSLEDLESVLSEGKCEITGHPFKQYLGVAIPRPIPRSLFGATTRSKLPGTGKPTYFCFSNVCWLMALTPKCGFNFPRVIIIQKGLNGI